MTSELMSLFRILYKSRHSIDKTFPTVVHQFIGQQQQWLEWHSFKVVGNSTICIRFRFRISCQS